MVLGRSIGLLFVARVALGFVNPDAGFPDPADFLFTEEELTSPRTISEAGSSTSTLTAANVRDLTFDGGAAIVQNAIGSLDLRSGGPGQNSTGAFPVKMMLAPGVVVTSVSFSYSYISGFGQDFDNKTGANFTLRAGGVPVYASPHLTNYSYDHNRKNYSTPVQVNVTGLSLQVPASGESQRLEIAFSNNDRNLQLRLPLVVSVTCQGSKPCAVPAPIPFTVAKALGDNMVLQRAPASAVVWGFASAGTTVQTSFNGAKYQTIADADGTWRQRLTPTAASGPYNLSFYTYPTGESAALNDVLFGDVYVCGGQSNMQFSVGGNENKDKYAKEANNYPNIRLFTVGQATSSISPLSDLQTIEQLWTKAGSTSVVRGKFDYFSAVCWFFGKGIYDGLGGEVPIGLVSNNWGGTRVEQWMSPETSAHCGHLSSGELYNAMIHPYTVGPMAVSGFTWYQGESDLGGDPAKPDPNNNYTCTQTAQIKQWRKEFGVPHAFYGIVQLSTWYTNPMLLAELRDQQLATGDLIPSFAYATNADYGAGGNIHPPYKQYPGARLANAALSIVYKKPINWRSPTYASAAMTGAGEVTVWLNDVTVAGLQKKDPFNTKTAGNCTALNARTPRTCAYAELQFDDAANTWVNATVALGADKKTMVLKAAPPAKSTKVLASRYGWGSIPMMTIYRADLDGQDGQLPVLPWSRNLAPAQEEVESGNNIVI